MKTAMTTQPDSTERLERTAPLAAHVPLGAPQREAMHLGAGEGAHLSDNYWVMDPATVSLSAPSAERAP